MHKIITPQRIIIDTCAWIAFFSYKANRSDLHNEALESESEVASTNVRHLLEENGRTISIVMPTCIYAELLGIIRKKARTPTIAEELVKSTIDFLSNIDFLFVELDELVLDEVEKPPSPDTPTIPGI